MSALLPLQNTYAETLDGLYYPLEPEGFPEPTLVAFNAALADELGLDSEAVRKAAASLFSGNTVPDGARPLAQAYAGHQFGHLSPQLGDGRALLLGELVGRDGKRRDLQLKGSGRTPFSRGGDGLATLGPVLREYLMGEAMYHLGIPTTRALAAVTTGDTVVRDGPLPGAVLARVAASHLRVGTFQFFAIRDDQEKVARLTAYAINRHYPTLLDAKNPALELLRSVARAQAHLISRWMLVGFVHGVMNTDNMTISGETIDYGPCAFMDSYSKSTVFSSIDRGGRYAYGNQPAIGKWNLARLAETLLPQIADDSDEAIPLAHAVLDEYTARYEALWLDGMRGKLGLTGEQPEDEPLVSTLLSLMESEGVDFTSLFRQLSTSLRGDPDPARELFSEADEFLSWESQWLKRVGEQDRVKTADAMDRINPLYIPRNHKVEEVLAAAHSGDYAPLQRLQTVLEQPFVSQPGAEDYAQPAPPTFGPYRTFCGT